MQPAGDNFDGWPSPLRVGVVGPGNIGLAVATLCVRAGYRVTICGRRSLKELEGLALVHGLSGAASVSQCAEESDVVIMAIPFHQVTTMPAGAFRGRVVVDATNFWPHRDSELSYLVEEMSSSEFVQTELVGSRVVKAFNNVKWQILRDVPFGSPTRLALPMAGDDRDALSVVAQLLTRIGVDPVFVGSLVTGGRLLEPGGSLHGLVGNAAMVRERATGDLTPATTVRPADDVRDPPSLSPWTIA